MAKQCTPRETALKILYNVEKNKAYVNLELKKQLQNNDYKTVDKGLITELVYGITKNKIKIDYVIKKFSSIRIKKISTWVLSILRMGIYQILYLDKIPDSAACNESVKLAKRYGHHASVKFVNGLLRNVTRNKENIKFPEKKQNPVEYISVTYSHPQWMVEEWKKEFGIDFTEDLCKANNEVPELIVRTNTLKITRDELVDILKEEGIHVKEGKYNEDALILPGVGNIETLSAFCKGLFQVQDESSMLVAKVLNPKPNELVIDACCAPGGKTTHIAQLMQNSGQIIGWDIHPHKIKLVESTATRLGIKNITAKEKDATILSENLIGKADRVLVDAPCSGLGIIRRKPDIKWKKTNTHLEDIVSLQQKILNESSKYVKPGGVLVYSTCTVEERENMGVVEAFLDSHKEFQLDPLKPYLNEQIKKDSILKGYVQLFPNIDQTDGFFICRMKRQG